MNYKQCKAVMVVIIYCWSVSQWVDSGLCLDYMYFQLILFSYILAFAFDVTEEKTKLSSWLWSA